jgi:hypothetical protein
MTEWIKCSERLPTIGEKVYMTLNEAKSIRMDLYYDSSNNRFEEEHDMGWWVEPKNKVTHWAEIPEAPHD